MPNYQKTDIPCPICNEPLHHYQGCETSVTDPSVDDFDDDGYNEQEEKESRGLRCLKCWTSVDAPLDAIHYDKENDMVMKKVSK